MACRENYAHATTCRRIQQATTIKKSRRLPHHAALTAPMSPSGPEVLRDRNLLESHLNSPRCRRHFRIFHFDPGLSTVPSDTAHMSLGVKGRELPHNMRRI